MNAVVPAESRASNVTRVSVIIPTRNRSRLLRRALASVLAVEGSDLLLDIIVADNGSTDETTSVARQFGARVVGTLTPGPAAARNAGLRVASGDFIAFLDDDDVWLPGQLRPQLALLRARPDFDAAIGQISRVNADLEPMLPPYPTSLPTHGDVFVPLLSSWWQIGALVLRKSVIESVGYMDEALLGGEEWDWMLRIALSHRIGFVRQPCLLFVGSREPGADVDALNAARVGWCRKVFWRNVRRAGCRRPSIAALLRAALRYDGVYVGIFLDSAVGHGVAGNTTALKKALMLALRTSPAHVAWAFLRRPEVRHVCGTALPAYLRPQSRTTHHG